MKRILVVFGTRPEAIKLAPVVKALSEHPSCEVSVCVTAQHREMLDQVLRIFGITPEYDLDLMSSNQTLASIASKVITGLSEVLEEYKPDIVLVHGDTTTTLAASLAAYYQKINIGHVEAGLRTGDIYSPWPEEVNRKVVASFARWNFAPTEQSSKNLLAENVDQKKIYITGNTVIDSLLQIKESIDNDPELQSHFNSDFSFLEKEKKLILVTAHRRENFGEGLESICKALKLISNRPDVQVVYPVHLNPNVQRTAKKYLGDSSNVFLLPPQDYIPFVYLMLRSTLILTDSGGIQEEAPSLGKPVIVLRNTTERPEAVRAGTVKLLGTSSEKIVAEVNLLLDDQHAYEKMAKSLNPYGDGRSAQRIAKILLNNEAKE